MYPYDEDNNLNNENNDNSVNDDSVNDANDVGSENTDTAPQDSSDGTYRIVKPDWSFGASANFSYLKNELIDLGNADGFEMRDNVHIIGNVSRAENGYPYPYFYGYLTNGIF